MKKMITIAVIETYLKKALTKESIKKIIKDLVNIVTDANFFKKNKIEKLKQHKEIISLLTKINNNLIKLNNNEKQNESINEDTKV